MLNNTLSSLYNALSGAYAAKGYFFQAALCHMASGDNVAASNKLEAFKVPAHHITLHHTTAHNTTAWQICIPLSSA